MQVTNRFALVFVLSVLCTIVMYDAGAAKVPVRSNSYPANEDSRRDLLFEQYDSFKSMQRFDSNGYLNKRQADRSSDENVTVLNNHHTYYTSKFFPPGDSADRLWFELSEMTGSGGGSGSGSGISSESGSSDSANRLWFELSEMTGSGGVSGSGSGINSESGSGDSADRLWFELSKMTGSGGVSGSGSGISSDSDSSDSADRLWFELSEMSGSGGGSGNGSGISSESGSGTESEIGYEIDSGAFVEELGENTTEVLSDAYRVYQIWQLKFSFPFYGHILDSVGVTTGGFLYTGTIYHPQIHLSQYIAPLMADFNPSLSAAGRVLVYSTEERFTVQWDQVLNQDHQNDGPFTFQVSIFPSGKIHLAYRNLPLLWNELNGDHPVEAGIADAFYFEVPGEFVFLVEYSRVSVFDLLADENTDFSYSAFEMDPVPNCVTANTCNSCMAITTQGIFNCSWCEAAEQKCSDGVDRFSQDWYDNGCFINAVSTCPLPLISPFESSSASFSATPSVSSATNSSSEALTFGILFAVLFLVALSAMALVGFLTMFMYSVRHPRSKLGNLVFKICPKAWKLEAASQSHELENVSQ